MRFLLLVSLVFVTPLFVEAQFSANNLLETNLSITSYPEYPSPGESVELSLNDYGGSAFGASVDWYLNDTLIPGSSNQRSISVTVGEAGSTDEVKVVLKRPNGGDTTLSKTFSPMYIDIIAEPETHVPGFYEGRALPSVGSTVYLTALLNNGAPMGRDYVYLWRVNQTVLEGGPLRGRNTISFVMPQDSFTIVSLQISKPDGTILGKRSIILPSTNPQIHFYETNALYGIETKSLKSFNMIGSSASIVAEPYYLDSRTFNTPNIIEWSVNNRTVSGDTNNPYSITLEKTGYPGRAKLEFHVRNTTSLLQGARNSVEINI